MSRTSRQAIRSITVAFLALGPGLTSQALAAAGCDTGNTIDVEASVGTPTAGYATLAAAFSAINAGTHKGTILIEVCGNTSEPAAGAILNASGSGSASYASILIKPVGGSARAISGAATAGLPLIDLNGADHVTFNGLNTGGDSLTISNTTASQTFGTSTIRFVNGASLNVVTNASIFGSFGGGESVSGGIIYIAADAITANGNDNITISNCDIGPAGAALPTKGIYISGSGTGAQNNAGIVISNNDIHDYFGASATSYGVYFAGGTSDSSVINNRFYQTATRTQTAGAWHSAIRIGNVSGNNFVVSGNTIGFASSTGSGTYTLVGVASTFFAPIHLSVGLTTATSVQGNTIAGIAVSRSGSGVSDPAPFYGISVLSGRVNLGDVIGNTIGSQSATGSITVTSSSTSASDVFGIQITDGTSVSLHNNTVGGITAANPSTGAANIYGIYLNTPAACQNNTIGGTVANSIQSTSTSNQATVQGIRADAGATIYGNTIRNLTAAGGTQDSASASVIGIATTSNSPPTISQNTIFNLTNTSPAAATVVTGIQVGNDFPFGGDVSVTGNRIYALKSASSSASAAVNGISVGASSRMSIFNNMIALGTGITNALGGSAANSATTGVNGIRIVSSDEHNIFHNSVYIDGSPTAGSGASYAFNGVETETPRSFRDNIFVNVRNRNGGATGTNYAIKLNGTTANSSGLTIDNNCYFATGTGTAFGFYDSQVVSDLGAWKTAVAQDFRSIQGDPRFLDPTNAIPDLHIDPAVTSPIEANGVDVGVADDFDFEARAALTPVDIGADAGNFIGVDLLGPAISYTPLDDTTSTSSRSITATMTDLSGVPTFGIGLPVLYWKVNAGAYAAATGSFVSGSTYSFVFGGGVSAGDVISYYIAAQDAAASPNVSVLPEAGAGGLTASPPAAATPPTTPNNYNVRQLVSGTKTVCASGCDYNSLTDPGGLFDDINNHSALNGDIAVLIASDLGGESGSIPLLQWMEEGAGGYRLTIKPVGAPRTVSGNGGGQVLIQITGADRVTLDGSLTGLSPSRDLTFNQPNTGSQTGTIRVSTGSNDVTIKNCIVKAGQTGSFTYGVSVGVSSGVGTDNDNFVFQNNHVSRAMFGFTIARGFQGHAHNVSIVDNTIGDDVLASSIGRTGMSILDVGAAAIVGNTIKNIFGSGDTIGMELRGLQGPTMVSHNLVTSVTASSSSSRGVAIAYSSGVTFSENTVDGVFATTGSRSPTGLFLDTDVVSSTITRNVITDVNYTGTGGFGGRGIDIDTKNAVSDLTISNNSISNIGGAGWNNFNGSAPFATAGIRIIGAVGGARFYHNSVNLGSGSFAGHASGTLSAAMYVSSTATAIDIRDNVFATNLVNTNAPSAKTYAIYSHAAASAFTSIDYNDYFATGTQAVLGYIASSIPQQRVTLAEWQASTGKDLSSIAADPSFTSTTNLRPLPPSPLIVAGTPIASVPIDITGASRSGTHPTIGAYETPREADVAVTIADSADPVATQANISYTIIATNNLPSDPTRITLLGATPARTTFVSFGGPSFGWSCNTPPVGGTGAISCTELVAGSSSVFTLVVKVNPCTGNTSTTNTVTVSSAVEDPNPANNTAVETTTITDDNSCNDGNPCTVNDQCMAGVCGGAAKDCADGNGCTNDGCNPANGACVHAPAAELTACGNPDDSACNAPDSCNATGTCIDRKKPTNTLCELASGDCDAVDVCDGVNDLCAPAYQSSTTECRPSSEECDPAEYCTGAESLCPADTTNVGVPVGNSVRVDHDRASSISTISWDEPVSGPFNVYRGTRLGTAPWQYNHGCYAQGLSVQDTSDGTTPVAGELYYYLISRNDTQCPESSLGPDSGGADRPNASPCP